MASFSCTASASAWSERSPAALSIGAGRLAPGTGLDTDLADFILTDVNVGDAAVHLQRLRQRLASE